MASKRVVVNGVPMGDVVRRGLPLHQFHTVTLESGEQIIVNMETIAFIRRHAHEPATDHTHVDGPLISLHMIAGGDIVIQDDGSWGL